MFLFMSHMTRNHITLWLRCIVCETCSKASMTMKLHKEVDHKNYESSTNFTSFFNRRNRPIGEKMFPIVRSTSITRFLHTSWGTVGTSVNKEGWCTTGTSDNSQWVRYWRYFFLQSGRGEVLQVLLCTFREELGTAGTSVYSQGGMRSVGTSVQSGRCELQQVMCLWGAVGTFYVQ